jgi:hypothetical protein
MRVLDALRASVASGYFAKNDWDSLRCAIRIVYETEELRVALRRSMRLGSTFAVSYWLESIESGITFMSWVRELADILEATTYPDRLPKGDVEVVAQTFLACSQVAHGPARTVGANVDDR